MNRALTALALLLCACSAKPRDPFVENVKALRPSVALLTLEIPSQDTKGGWDESYGTAIAIASGDFGTDFLTVRHVIAGGRHISATIADKRRLPARVVAEDSGLDVAVINVRNVKLPPVALGTSAEVVAGEQVGIVGYPIPDSFAAEGLGIAPSVNAGRVSSIRKHALELNLPVIPGESGGPVFAADDGRVIGIAESRFDEERSIGFAVPIDEAKPFIHKYAHGV